MPLGVFAALFIFIKRLNNSVNNGNKNYLLYFSPILIIILAITISGCKTNAVNPVADNTTADNPIADNTVPNDGKSFPLSFIGTWKKDNFNNTITFTQDTLKASNQSYAWHFLSVSGDVYKIKPGNYNYIYTLTIKINNGNLEISGDTAANSENNWNGVWKKQ
jgi:hypothetical protein